MKPTIDDIQLTAYALGEGSPAERRALEAQLQANPALQATVDEIRALAERLESELKDEPAPALTDAQRQAILAAPARADRPLLRFPWRPVAGFAAVAAAVVLAFVGSFRGASRALDRQQSAATPPERIEVAMLPAPPDELRESETSPHKPDDTTRGPAQSVPEPLAAPAAVAPAVTPPLAAAESRSGQVGDKRMEALYSRSEAMPDAVLDLKPAEGKEEIQFAAAPKAPAKELSEKVSQKTVVMSPLAMRGLASRADRDGSDQFQAYGGGWAPFPDSSGTPPNTESYAPIQGNAFKRIADEPLSTFSIDVDTASYANVRRFLQHGQRPPPDAVRIEEMINYFPYDYAPPQEDVPFAVHVESAACPWNPAHQLVKIGLKGRELAAENRPPCNLVFLIDVSGSMSSENKLPLVKKSLQLLARQLSAADRVSIVVYASATGLVLPPTPGNDLATLDAALERLQAGGSTAGGAGIRLAYDEALKSFQPDGNNRVILCTDGDFNVGITDSEELAAFIAGRARKGIFLTILGFGMGNYKDDRLETLSNKGNGNYAYIDSFSEARKTLAEQVAGTLFAIAKDVKLQIEFNPARFDAYRLVGYENRLLAKEDFNNDQKDAGELGAGHVVTAFYELVPAGVESAPGVDPLKYRPQPAAETAPAARTEDASPEWLTVKLRYKLPREDRSTKLEVPFTGSGAAFENASGDFRFAAGVAAAGFLLRQDPAVQHLSFDEVIQWTAAAAGADPAGYRREFIDLLKNAAVLAP